MSAPGEYNFTKDGDGDRRFVEGADNEVTLSFDDTYGADWTGFGARAQIREGYRRDAPVIEATMTAQILSAGPSQRIIRLSLPSAAEFSGATCGRWDCEIYNGTVVYRVVMGKWALNREVTE